MKVLERIKGKVDKKALYTTICLLLMSWAAFPIIYLLLKRAYKEEREVKKDESMG